MFTGIIQHVGRIERAEATPEGGRALVIDVGPLAQGLALGESVAVQGACLTVARRQGRRIHLLLSDETCARTTLGAVAAGAAVNLERALCLGDRLGGHLVSGHVDGIGTVARMERRGAQARLVLTLPRTVQVIEKGSLAVDGVSLTTFQCRGRSVEIALIAHTLTHTTLGGLAPGDRVNCEQDLIGRWVARMLPGRRPR